MKQIFALINAAQPSRNIGITGTVGKLNFILAYNSLCSINLLLGGIITNVMEITTVKGTI